MMKIIFVSPYTPLWSNDLKYISLQIDAEIIYLGDLLRAEIKALSELGKKIEFEIRGEGLINPELISNLVVQHFISNPRNNILVDFPRSSQQALSFTVHKDQIKGNLQAIVVVKPDIADITKKFSQQYHCTKDSSHPKIESTHSTPKCLICKSQLEHSYDVKSEKIKLLIEAYCKQKDGQLANVLIISNALGAEYIEFTCIESVVNKILLCVEKNV